MADPFNEYVERTVGAHEGLSRYTKFLALVTLLIFLGTLAGAIVAYKALQDNKVLNRAEFVYKIDHDFSEFMIADPKVEYWYYKEDTVLHLRSIIDSPDFVKWRKSFSSALNFFEDLNALYKKGLIDKDVVEDLFGGTLVILFRKPIVHEYIQFRREKAIKDYGKSDCKAALIFDAIYIWAERFNIHCDASQFNDNRWREYYYQDQAPNEKLYTIPNEKCH